ncbi:MAG: hypothetical protein QRY71_01755 [Candidatus Rhabdochlamydia sp.]
MRIFFFKRSVFLEYYATHPICDMAFFKAYLDIGLEGETNYSSHSREAVFK